MHIFDKLPKAIVNFPTHPRNSGLPKQFVDPLIRNPASITTLPYLAKKLLIYFLFDENLNFANKDLLIIINIS